MSEIERKIEQTKNMNPTIANEKADIYTDDNLSSWYQMPFQVSFSKKFTTLHDVLEFRTEAFAMRSDQAAQYETKKAENANKTPTWEDLSQIFKDTFGIGKTTPWEYIHNSHLGEQNQNPEVDTSLVTDDMKSIDVAPITGRPYNRDTRVGANDAINCIWQYNRDDDITHPITYSEPNRQLGEGRVYSTTTEQNQTIAWFTFGVSRFTNISGFLAAMTAKDLATMNNTGFSAKGLGHIFGDILSLAFALPVWGIELFISFVKRYSEYPVDRFCTMRPTMHIYYRYVDSILAEWLVDVGLLGNGTTETKESRGIIMSILYTIYEIGAAIIDKFTPDFIKDMISTGGKVVGTVAEAVLPEFVIKAYKEITGGEKAYAVNSLPLCLQETGASIWNILARRARLSFNNGYKTNESFIDEWNNMVKQDFTGMSNDDIRHKIGEIDEEYPEWAGDGLAANLPDEPDGESFVTTLKKTASCATQFIGFRIEKSTDASESFSNSTEPNPIGEQINNFSTTRRSFNYSLGATGAEGIQVGDGPLSSLVEGVFGATDTILQKTGQFVGLEGLATAVTTGSFVDLPEQYRNSSFNKSHNFNFKLRSPYGDIVSIYQSIIIPLACILAGSLPRAAGPSSYSSPFLCRVYCKGMFSIPLGIIESLSIRRGNPEYGWSIGNLPLAIDVSMTVKDLSPVLYMTMNDSLWATLMSGTNNFREYIQTLSAMGVYERVSRVAQFKRNLQLFSHKIRNTYLNPLYWSNVIGDCSIPQFIAGVCCSDSLPH